eukprot:162973_1
MVFRNSVQSIELFLFTMLCSYPLLSLMICSLLFIIYRYKAYYKYSNTNCNGLNKDQYNVFNRYNNFLIIGSHACGKSSLARQLKLLFPHLELIELDQIYWKPNWKRNNSKFYMDVKTSLFTDKIKQTNERKLKHNNGVIIDGNYNRIKDMTWKIADVVVWLDYDFIEVFYRAIKRTFWRIITKQQVCNGNFETFTKLLNDFESSVIYQVWNNHQKINKETIPNDFIRLFPNKKIIRFESPYYCNQWLKRIKTP